MSSFSWIDELVERVGFWRVERFPWAPPTDSDVGTFEAEVGGTLPSEYRYFVSKYGSGMLGNDDFKVVAPIAEPCPWGQVVRPELFYPLLATHRDSLQNQLQTYAGRIPRGVAAISDDAGGNQVCLDVAGEFPGSVWFWDHEQRWFTGNLEEAAQELDARGTDARRLSVHGIIRGWARLHANELDRPADYMGCYRMAASFEHFLRLLRQVPY